MIRKFYPTEILKKNFKFGVFESGNRLDGQIDVAVARGNHHGDILETGYVDEHELVQDPRHLLDTRRS